jgi:hypothetical protein
LGGRGRRTTVQANFLKRVRHWPENKIETKCLGEWLKH